MQALPSRGARAINIEHAVDPGNATDRSVVFETRCGEAIRGATSLGDSVKLVPDVVDTEAGPRYTDRRALGAWTGSQNGSVALMRRESAAAPTVGVGFRWRGKIR